MEQIFELKQGNFEVTLYESQSVGLNIGRIFGSHDCGLPPIFVPSTELVEEAETVSKIV